MTKKIHLNAFEMNCAVHLSSGLWKHPDDNRHQYKDVEYWTDLAKYLEKGKFDALFLADVSGVYDVYKQSKDPAIKEGLQVPVNDPAFVIPAMAAVTKYLGFAVTISTTYEQPFSHARRLSTLDHLTKGRIAWNVVTSYLPSMAKNFGLTKMINHDKRYEMADEFLEVCYKLWEGSWEEGAVVRDVSTQTYSDPNKVHYIDHEGTYFQVPGPHLSEPSIQRTPVIYQAGSSEQGITFAGKHAESVFLGGTTVEVLKKQSQEIKKQAKAYGRNPEHIKMFASVTTVVGRTREEAIQKLEEYQEYYSLEGVLVHFSGSSGYNLATYNDDDYLTYVKTDHTQSSADQFTKNTPKQKNVGEIKEQLSKIGERGLFIVGSAEEVADQLQFFIDEADIDGFNVLQVISPGTLKDFVELVIPELQRRGVFREEYEEGTMRERLFGKGNINLPKSHPGAKYRKLRSLNSK